MAVTEEFNVITQHIAKYYWDNNYFTIPLPRKPVKEFKIDMPAFERFDLFVTRWQNGEIDVKAVESKFNPKEAIPQARTYQLCIPEVFIASVSEQLEKEFFEKLNSYGIGYIEVFDNDVVIKLEPRISYLFNIRFYEEEILPKAVTILLFNDFISHELGYEKEEILKKVDFGIRKDYLWLSHRKATEGIQWSMIYNGKSIKFGINLESVYAIRKAFHEKSEKEIENMFNKLRVFPKNFWIRFERRCPENQRFKRGGEHVAYNEFPEREKPLHDLRQKDEKFMIKKLQEDSLIEFGIWATIAQKNEVIQLPKDFLRKKIKQLKKTYFDSLYEMLS